MQHLLLHSENKNFVDTIRGLLEGFTYSLRHINYGHQIGTLEHTYKPAIVLIELKQDKAELASLYDAISQKFPDTKVIVVYTHTLPFSYDDLGIRKAQMIFVQRPFEDEVLLDKILELAPVHIPTTALKLEHLLPIRISDMRPTDQFDFDLFYYMPINQKIIFYRPKKSTISQEQIKKFEKHHIHDLYIRKTDAHAFHEYAIKKLKQSFSEKKTSVTQRRAALQKEVKDLFGNFFDAREFDPKRNRAILNTCKQVVGDFILDVSPRPEIYEQILYYTAQVHSNYNHAVTVSVFTSLFSLAFGLEDIATAAIGGLLHDIGHSALPEKMTKKQYADLTKEEKAIYHNHPLEGAKLLEKKKMVAGDQIMAVISQHHEHMDGTGYPMGLKKDQIHMMARICQIADELDKLTSVVSGKAPLSPHEALKRMIKQNTETGGERFDGELLTQLQSLFSVPSAKPLELGSVKDIFEKPVIVAPSKTDPNSIDTDDVRRRKRHKKLGSKAS